MGRRIPVNRQKIKVRTNSNGIFEQVSRQPYRVVFLVFLVEKQFLLLYVFTAATEKACFLLRNFRQVLSPVHY